MTEQDDAAAQYEGLTEDLVALGDVVCAVLKEILSEERVSVHAITPRVKQRQSAVKKLAKASMQGRSMDSLTDLLGVRVITFFEDGVDAAAEAVLNDFDIHADKSTDKRASLQANQFGYQSVHYIAELSKVRTSLPEYRRFAGKVFEIQIRSMLQHAWAEIEHDLGYKAEQAIPVKARRRFSRLAGLLELADEEFAAIRDQLKSHRADARSSVFHEESTPLDQDSVLTLIKTSPEIGRHDRAVLQAVAGSSSGRLTDATSEFAGERAAELLLIGITTTAELLEALSDRGDEIVQFATMWQSGDYPNRAAWDWSRDGDQVQKTTEVAGVELKDDSIDEPAMLQLPSGICFSVLYQLDRGNQALRQYRENGTWTPDFSSLDRASAVCLAQLRDEEPPPREA